MICVLHQPLLQKSPIIIRFYFNVFFSILSYIGDVDEMTLTLTLLVQCIFLMGYTVTKRKEKLFI